jgi:hypothetical protein
MLYFLRGRNVLANLNVLITDHLNRWNQKLYIDYESNLIIYDISQQIKGFNLSNLSHHVAKNTKNEILKLLKLVLNLTSLKQILDSKKKMRLVDTFPMVYNSHCLNISFGNCRKVIWCSSVQNRRTVIRKFKNYAIRILDRLIGQEVQPSYSRKFNLKR